MTSTLTSNNPLVARFNATERWLHWAFAIPFILTFATGLALFFPELQKLAGSREVVRNLHRFLGLATVVLPLLVIALGDRKQLAADAGDIDLWSRQDQRWFRAWLWRKAGGRDTLPPQGRFNAGQKFNAVITLAALFWLSLTGLVIFPGLHPPFWLVANSRSLHNITWMVITPAVLGHIFLAAIYPPTRPGLSGIITGQVRRDWLATHHPLSPELGSPAQDTR
jgi:formate dehydrogenase subunit gamma